MSDEADIPVQSIASLASDARVRVSGVVRALADAPLESQIAKLPCVYWDVRNGLDDAPEDSAAQSFWIEDASGRVLIPEGRIDVDARAERRKTVLMTVANDLVAVENRLREIKDEQSRVAGAEASRLQREKKHLSKVATLLCAIRAHARGRVHGRGTLRSQEAWIRENSQLTAGGALGAASTQLMADRWETVLRDGDAVDAIGVVSIEPAPPESMRGASYRSVATVTALREVRIVGTGASAPPTEAERRAIEREHPRDRAPRRGDRSQRGIPVGMIGVGAAVVAAVVAYFASR